MPTTPAPQTPLSTDARVQILRFAAAFLWADLELRRPEREFLTELGRELDIDVDEALFDAPPFADDIDPNSVDIAMADTVRSAALRAIASDGEIATTEMHLFELLDELLPRRDEAATR